MEASKETADSKWEGQGVKGIQPIHFFLLRSCLLENEQLDMQSEYWTGKI